MRRAIQSVWYSCFCSTRTHGIGLRKLHLLWHGKFIWGRVRNRMICVFLSTLLCYTNETPSKRCQDGGYSYARMMNYKLFHRCFVLATTKRLKTNRIDWFAYSWKTTSKSNNGWTYVVFNKQNKLTNISDTTQNVFPANVGTNNIRMSKTQYVACCWRRKSPEWMRQIIKYVYYYRVFEWVLRGVQPSRIIDGCGFMCSIRDVIVTTPLLMFQSPFTIEDTTLLNHIGDGVSLRVNSCILIRAFSTNK